MNHKTFIMLIIFIQHIDCSSFFSIFTGTTTQEPLKIKIKIVFFGNSFAGKTSLIQTYVSSEFPTSFETTTCPEVYSKHVKLDTGESVEFEIWDTAGQAGHFAATTNYYFKVGNVLAFVFEAIDTISASEDGQTEETNSLLAIEAWIERAERHAALGDKLLVLVAAKMDVVPPEDKLEMQKVGELAKMYDMVFCSLSAYKNRNVDECFAWIAERYIAKFGTSDSDFSSLEPDATEFTDEYLEHLSDEDESSSII